MLRIRTQPNSRQTRLGAGRRLYTLLAFDNCMAAAAEHSMSWSAAQYTKFEDERSRPARDLVARISDGNVAEAVDIGCGPGNSTQLLQQRFPHAAVTGIDSSPDMIEAARKRLPGVRFDIADIVEWKKNTGPLFDVILSNAVLQWVPDHEVLFPALLARLTQGGRLAVQMPHTLEEPASRRMREIAADGPWAHKLATVASTRIVRHNANWYYRLLRECGAAVDIW